MKTINININIKNLAITLRGDTMDLPIQSSVEEDRSWKLNFKHGRRVMAIIEPNSLWVYFSCHSPKESDVTIISKIHPLI